jgi:hypothetical protein
MNVIFSKEYQCKAKRINYIESTAKQEWLFMKRVLAFSAAITISLLLTTSLTQISTQMVDAQTLPPSEFNFAAAGDWGCTEDTTNTVNNTLDKKPELVLGLGDYSYNKTTDDCWFKIVDPIDEIMKIAIGNHDEDSSAQLNSYMNHFNLTKQYYSFDYENLHFIAVSTEIPYNKASLQYDFVNNDLFRAASNPNIDWIVVYFHRPMYSSPTHHAESPNLRDTYHPLFERYGVDLVLQGHNHNYERTYPIRFNSNNPLSPIETSTNTTTYVDPKGQIFATVGTGGKDLYSFDGKKDYFVKQYEGFGILDVDITNNDGKMLTCKFYANNNKIIDQFTITKSN